MIGSTPEKASFGMDLDSPLKQKPRSVNTPAVPTKAPLTREEPMLAIEGSAADSTDSTASFRTADQGSLISMGSWSSLVSNASSHLGMSSKKRGKQKAKIEDSSEELVHKPAAVRLSLVLGPTLISSRTRLHTHKTTTIPLHRPYQVHGSIPTFPQLY